ncbi:hypothetical protein [Bradyrhizobium sp. AZCC 2289]
MFADGDDAGHCASELTAQKFSCEEVEARAFTPRVVLVDEENRILPS